MRNDINYRHTRYERAIMRPPPRGGGTELGAVRLRASSDRVRLLTKDSASEVASRNPGLCRRPLFTRAAAFRVSTPVGRRLLTGR